MTEKINDYTYAEKQKALDEAWEIMNPASNAERIEEARKLIHRTILQLNSRNLLSNEDIENYYWIIKRAERADELEKEIKSHAPEGRNYTNEQYVSLRFENKRLLGLFKEIHDYDAYSWNNDRHFINYRIKKALEGEPT